MAQRFSSPLRARTTTNPQVTAPKNIDQYLADLDNLLKRNTGSGTLIGQDTTSNVPMYVPGKVINPTGVGMSNNVSQTGNGITQPSPVQRNQPIAQPEDIQPMSASDFLSQLDQTFYDPGNQVPVDGLIPGQDLIDYNQGMASERGSGI